MQSSTLFMQVSIRRLMFMISLAIGAIFFGAIKRDWTENLREHFVCSNIHLNFYRPYKCRKGINESFKLKHWLDNEENSNNIMGIIRIQRHCSRYSNYNKDYYEKFMNNFKKNSKIYNFLSNLNSKQLAENSGQITMYGMKESYEIGANFYKMFKKFIDDLESDEIKAKCSIFQRTCDTMQKFMLGIFKDSSIVVNKKYVIQEPSLTFDLAIKKTVDWNLIEEKFSEIYNSILLNHLGSQMVDNPNWNSAIFKDFVSHLTFEYIINSNRIANEIFTPSAWNEIDKFIHLLKRNTFSSPNEYSKKFLKPLAEQIIHILDEWSSHDFTALQPKFEKVNLFFSHDDILLSLMENLELSKENSLDIPMCSNLQFILIDRTQNKDEIIDHRILVTYNDEILDISGICGSLGSIECSIDKFLQKFRRTFNE